MGPPGGRGDWAASVHDYNFMTNDIKISSYFNPTLKLATANALIKSNNTLMRNAGGVQSVKMFLVFFSDPPTRSNGMQTVGSSDAFQSFVHRGVHHEMSG